VSSLSFGKETNMETTANEIQRRRPAQRSVLDGLEPRERELYDQIPEMVEYVDHPSFAAPKTEKQLFGEEAPEVEVPRWTHFPEVPDEAARPSRGRGSLSAKDEMILFLRYNYAKYRLAKLLSAQSKRRSLGRSRRMVHWYARAQSLQADVVGGNMALVVAMAKRTRIPNVEFSELISEGNLALLRCVEKFDVSRGFKFSTYSCRAILKSFNRLATKTGRYRQRFPTEFDPELERSDYDVHRHEMQRDDTVDSLREILSENRASLSELERTVVMERFAIGSEDPKRRTLAEVGRVVGLTNERVRQIQNLALGKLREVLDESYLVI
jgi:RNA polymerase primary sigma factor